MSILFPYSFLFFKNIHQKKLKNRKKNKKIKNNENEKERENKDILSNEKGFVSLLTKLRYKKTIDKEDNHCEQLICLHLNVKGCLLIIEGFHSKITFVM